MNTQNMWFQQDGASSHTAKEKMYISDLQTIVDPQENIIYEIGEIKSQFYQNVIENLCKRIGACYAAAGGHLHDIIFIVNPDYMYYHCK